MLLELPFSRVALKLTSRRSSLLLGKFAVGRDAYITLTVYDMSARYSIARMVYDLSAWCR